MANTVISKKWSIRLGSDGYEIIYLDAAPTTATGTDPQTIFDGLAAADLVDLSRALRAFAILDPLVREQTSARQWDGDLADRLALIANGRGEE